MFKLCIFTAIDLRHCNYFFLFPCFLFLVYRTSIAPSLLPPPSVKRPPQVEQDERRVARASMSSSASKASRNGPRLTVEYSFEVLFCSARARLVRMLMAVDYFLLILRHKKRALSVTASDYYCYYYFQTTTTNTN